MESELGHYPIFPISHGFRQLPHNFRKIKNNFGFRLLFVFECIIFGSESMGTYWGKYER